MAVIFECKLADFKLLNLIFSIFIIFSFKAHSKDIFKDDRKAINIEVQKDSKKKESRWFSIFKPSPKLSDYQIRQLKEYQECYNFQIRSMVPDKFADKSCLEHKHYSRFYEPDMEQCYAYMKDIARSTRYNDPSAPLLCFFTDSKFPYNNSDTQQCIKQTMEMTAPWYWFLDNYYELNSHEIISTCSTSKTDISNSNNSKIKVIGRTIFHNYTNLVPTKGEKLPKAIMGGLSGLVFTDNETLMAISDDKSLPALFKFKLRYNSFTSQAYIEYIETSRLNSGITDVEDIALWGNNNFIVSTEALITDSIRKYGVENKEKISLPQSYLFEINDKGHFLNNIDLPEDLFPISKQIETDCPKFSEKKLDFAKPWFEDKDKLKINDKSSELNLKLPELKNIHYIPEGSVNLDEQGPPKISYEEKKKCYSQKITHGFKPNKGLEGIATNSNLTKLVFAPENALMPEAQTRVFGQYMGRNIIPLFVQDLTTGNYSVYKYPIDEKNDFGITAMKFVNDYTLITLERTYHPRKDEAEVKIYKINLKSGNSSQVKKTLIGDVKDLVSKYSKTFTKVGNFEGLAFIEDPQTDSYIIVLTADNNFNPEQNNEFLILKASRSIFK